MKHINTFRIFADGEPTANTTVTNPSLSSLPYEGKVGIGSLPTVDRRSNYSSSTCVYPSLPYSSLSRDLRTFWTSVAFRVASLLCVLFLGIGQMWGEATTTLDLSTLTSSNWGNWSGGTPILNNNLFHISAYTAFKSTGAQTWISDGGLSSGSATWSATTHTLSSTDLNVSNGTKVRPAKSIYFRITGCVAIYVNGKSNNTSSNQGQARLYIYNNGRAEDPQQGYFSTSGSEVAFTNLNSSTTYELLVDGTANSDGSWFYAVAFEKYSSSSTYTLTLDANGGTIASTPEGWTKATNTTLTKTVASGTKIPLPALSCVSRTGYTVDNTNWYDEEGDDYAPSYQLTLNEDLTLYAHWTADCTPPTSVDISGTQEYTVGDNISLTAAATGGSGTASYQWKKGGVDISGATSATYTKNSCTADDAGTYTCTVSTGATCSTTSDGYAITVSGGVTPGPTPSGAIFAGNETELVTTEIDKGGYVSQIGDGGSLIDATASYSDYSKGINYASGSSTANYAIKIIVKKGYKMTGINVAWYSTNGGRSVFIDTSPTKTATETYYQSPSVKKNTKGADTRTNLDIPAGTYYVNVTGSYVLTHLDVTIVPLTPSTTHTVTFHKNDGSATEVTATQTGIQDNTATALTSISTIGWSRTGYTFDGWAESASAEVAYTDGANIILTANKDLYAKWTCTTPTIKTNLSETEVQYTQGATAADLKVAANETFSLSYQWQQSSNKSSWSNISGATSDTYKPSTATTGTTYYCCTITNAVSGCSTSVTSKSATITVNAPKYTVTYNGNNNTSGSVPTDGTEYASGATVTVKDNTGSLARNGYTFAGWNTQADGSGTTYTAGSGQFQISANTTLYAKWTAKTAPTVTWTYVPATVYAGGKYTFTVSTNSDATLDADKLTADNATLENKVVNGNTITATMKIAADETEAPSLRFQADATSTYSASDETKNITLGSCSGGGGGTKTIYSVEFKDNKANPIVNGGDFVINKGLDDTPVEIDTKKYYKFGTSSKITFTPTNGIKEDDIVTLDFCLTSSDKTDGYILYDATGTLATLTTSSSSAPSAQTLSHTFTADISSFYIMRSNSNQAFHGLTITRPGSGGEKQTPTMSWSEDVTDGVTKSTTESPFTISASANTIGAITYSLSNVSGTISIDSETGAITASTAGSATVTATVAAVGCYSSTSISYNLTVTAPEYDITKASATNGSFTVSAERAAAGTEITLAATPNPGYQLGSWSVYETGDESTTVNVDNNKFNMPAYPVTVAATFTAKNYTLTLKANDGASTADIQRTVTYDANFDATNFTPHARTGYKLKGYYTSETDGDKIIGLDDSSWKFEGGTHSGYTKSQKWNGTEDKTLYAHWDANQYDITYKDQGGSAFSGTHDSGKPTKHTYGTATTLKGASKDGFTFDGWFTTSSCTGSAVTKLDATAYTDDITLYAKWTAAVIPVTSVTLNKTTTSIAVSGTETLTATVAPANATNQNVTWSSDDEDVATVEDGVVTAVAAGTATITVTTEDGNFTATCTVTVTGDTPQPVEETCGYIENSTEADNYAFDDFTIYYSSANDNYKALTRSGSTSNLCGNATHRIYMKGAVVYLKNTSASRIVLKGQQDYDVTPVNIKVADALDGTYNSLTATNVNYTNKSCGELGISNVNIAKGKYVFIGFSGGEKNEFRVSGVCVTPSSSTPTTRTITLNPNGGSFTSTPSGWTKDGDNLTAQVAEGSTLTLPNCSIVSRSEYTADGWYTGTTDGTKYTTITYADAANVSTLYPHWTETPEPGDCKLVNLVFATGKSTCVEGIDQTKQILSNNDAVSSYIQPITFVNVEGEGDNGAEGGSLNAGKKAGNQIVIAPQSGYVITDMSFYGKIEPGDNNSNKIDISLDGGNTWPISDNSSLGSDALHCNVVSNANATSLRIKIADKAGVWIRNMQIQVCPSSTPTTTYKYTIDLNGGTLNVPTGWTKEGNNYYKMVKSGDTFSFPAVGAVTKANYTFDKWLDEGGDNYPEGGSFTVASTEDYTFTAQWKDAPTPTHDYAEDVDFVAIANELGKRLETGSEVEAILNEHNYFISEASGIVFDPTAGRDGGFGIESTSRTLSFWVKADQKVSITVGTLVGDGGGSATLYQYDENGDEIPNTEATITNETTTYYETDQITEFRFVTQSIASSWNRIQQINIVPATCPDPVITTQPTQQEGQLGSDITFSMEATGAESYQWYRADDADGTNKVKIEGAESDSYTFTTQATGITYYGCKVIADCGAYVFTNFVGCIVQPKDFLVEYEVGVANNTTYVWGAGTNCFTQGITLGKDDDEYISNLTNWASEGITLSDKGDGTLSPLLSMVKAADYDPDKYIYFTFDLAQNQQIQLANLSFTAKANGGSQRKFKVVISDNHSHEYVYETTSGSSSVFNINETITSTTKFSGTITLKLYSWYSGSNDTYRLGKYISLSGKISSLPTPDLDWTTAPTDGQVGDDKAIAAASTNLPGAEVTYSSDNETVATIVNGNQIHYVGEGDALIYARIDGDGITYHSDGKTISQSISVTAPTIQYAQSVDFVEAARTKEKTVSAVLNEYHYTISSLDKVSWDYNTDGKPSDCGLKIENYERTLSFLVPANKNVTIQVGTIDGCSEGIAYLSQNGGDFVEIKGASYPQNPGDPGYGDPETYTYSTTQETSFVIKTKAKDSQYVTWNLIQKILIDDVKYTVTYNDGNDNDNDLADPNSPYVANTPVSVLAYEDLFTLPEGKEFDYWKNQSEERLEVGESFSITANTIITAVLKDKQVVGEEHTITYLAGDATGKVPAQQTVESGTTITMPEKGELAKEGYSFTGWSDGTTTYSAGQSYTMPNKDVNMTAQWKENEDVECETPTTGQYLFEGNTTVGKTTTKTISTSATTYDAFFIDDIKFSSMKLTYEGGTGGYGGWKINTTGATISFCVEANAQVAVRLGTCKSNMKITYVPADANDNGTTTTTLAKESTNTFMVKGDTKITLTTDGNSTITLKEINIGDPCNMAPDFTTERIGLLKKNEAISATQIATVSLTKGKTNYSYVANSASIEDCGLTVSVTNDGKMSIVGTPVNTGESMRTVYAQATFTNSCDPAKTFVIRVPVYISSGKPYVAYVVDGKANGAFNAYTEHSDDSLYTKLTANFDVQMVNAYASVDQDKILDYYSQFDVVVITDYPDTHSKSGNMSYSNALGWLVDVKPVLTMETFVSNLSNWKAKGLTSNPVNPSGDDKTNEMTLLCNANDIFGTSSEHFKAGSTHIVTSESTDPCLQGFAPMDAPDFVFIASINGGSHGTLITCCERQAKPEARMVVLGMQQKVYPKISDCGYDIVKGLINYLTKTDPASIPDCSIIFNGNGTDDNWSTDANWEGGVKPNHLSPVRIDAPCVVDVTDAQAGTVKIHQGTANEVTYTGSITVNPGKALAVSKSISRVEGSEYATLLPTTARDLTVQADAANGSGVLVIGKEEGTNEATIEQYTLAKMKDNSIRYWQYIALPVDGINFMDEFYGKGVYTYLHDEPTAGGWIRVKDTEGYFFKAYGLTQPEEKTYTFTGHLAPTTNQTISLTYTADGNEGMNMIGNSWTAPIDITKFETSDFKGVETEATIYIYNTGNDNENQGDAYAQGSTTAGQWLSIPVEVAKQQGYKGLKVIPVGQAFEVHAQAGGGSISIDYQKLVMNGTRENQPMRAPARRAAEETSDVDLMRIRVEGGDTHIDQYLLEGAQFTTGFDNGWDGKYMEGDDRAAGFYSVNNELGNMSVNALPMLEGTVLGFTPNSNQNYMVTFNYNGAIPYYFNDLQTQQSTLIRAGESYMFTTSTSDITNRFQISTTPYGSPIITDLDSKHIEEVPFKFIEDEHLYIIHHGVLFDGQGKLVR